MTFQFSACRKYWATCSSVHSFACTSHSFACSGLLASLAPSAAPSAAHARLLCSFPCSWESKFLMPQMTCPIVSWWQSTYVSILGCSEPTCTDNKPRRRYIGRWDDQMEFENFDDRRRFQGTVSHFYDELSVCLQYSSPKNKFQMKDLGYYTDDKNSRGFDRCTKKVLVFFFLFNNDFEYTNLSFVL